jgi:hypothetical protein
MTAEPYPFDMALLTRARQARYTAPDLRAKNYLTKVRQWTSIWCRRSVASTAW